MTEGPSHQPASEAADALDNGFWRFSLAVYGRPGVPECLIGLQDALSVDANVMLFAMYVALHRPEGVAAQDIARWNEAARVWRDSSVIPLRAIRRGLKTAPEAVARDWREAVRTKVAGAELAAERIEQALLFSLLPGGTRVARPPDPQAAVAAAIAAVLDVSGADGRNHTPEMATLTEAALSQL